MMRASVRRAFFPIVALTVLPVIVMTLAGGFSNAQGGGDPAKLCVVWTSADRDAAIKMVYMYTLNAKKQGWFDRVQFVIWGPSSKLLAEDGELQEYLAKMKDEGVELTACIACADMYGVTEKLRGLGVDVKGMGRPLTEMLKSGWKTVTF